LVAQEWIEGPDTSIYFALFHCGAEPNSRDIFFGRKIAAHPPGLGSTAICVPAAEATDLLLPLTEKFIEISEYEGLGSLEFKWDSRARRFVIIEPTVGRTDWQEEIATLNGLNFPLIAYCDALGLPLPEQRSSNAAGSPFANTAAWRESPLHLWRSAELRERVYDGYWRFDDPLPALAFCVDLALRCGHRLLTRPVFERRKPPFRRRRIA
jgi:D-aspartate ligase